MRIENLLSIFRGRASRMRFWLVVSIILPSYIALLMIAWFYALSTPAGYENGGTTPMPKGPFGIVEMVVFFGALFALTVALFAVSLRRLHDRDKGWWWVLLFLAVPNLLSGFAQAQIATYGGENVSGAIMGAFYLGYVLLIWGIVEMGFLPGTKGDNRFGPDPLAQQAAAR